MKKRILFVEDEPRGVTPYFDELEKNGFKCTLVEYGDAAIKKLETETFHLVSIDIMFTPGEYLGEDIKPIKAGVTLLDMIRSGKIKKCDPDIKVVVLTAVIDYEIEAQIRKLNVSAYLKKPIEFSKVIETFCNLKP